MTKKTRVKAHTRKVGGKIQKVPSYLRKKRPKRKHRSKYKPRVPMPKRDPDVEIISDGKIEIDYSETTPEGNRETVSIQGDGQMEIEFD